MKARIRCPNCNSAAISSRGKRYAFYPLVWVIFVGFPIALMHQASAPIDYACSECRQEFKKRSAVAKFWLGALVVLILWTVVAMVQGIFGDGFSASDW